MRSRHKNNVRIGILVVKLLLKEVLHKFLGGLAQKLDFPRFQRRPFWKRVNIWKCSRDLTWHPPESWRAIPRLQETVEKKTLSGKTTFTPNQGFWPRASNMISPTTPMAPWGVVLIASTACTPFTAGHVSPNNYNLVLLFQQKHHMFYHSFHNVLMYEFCSHSITYVGFHW